MDAKRESKGASDSGFSEFREFIRKAVESGGVWRMKFEGARDTAGKVLSQILEKVCRDEAALADDLAFLQRLRAKVASRREKANGLRRLVVDNLSSTYDALARQLERNFREGLSVGSILRGSLPLVRDKTFQTWLERAARAV